VLPIAANARLLVVADGALHYLPFGMLPLPGAAASPLITRAEIVNLPSASMLAVQRGLLAGRTRAANTLAILADPVFDATDPRVTPSSAAASLTPEPVDGSRLLQHLAPSSIEGARAIIPRLPATAAEARAITAAAGGAGLAVTGFDARKGVVTGDRLKGYRYVHFATHGFVDSVNPSLSAIVLSLVDRDGRPQDGFLRADELYGLELSADMVVLSACQTGLGKEIRGEGLVGLTRGLMYAGAATVVVSLWSVSDNATADLMARFYRELISAGRSPAAALRAAQLLLLKQTRWTHPYYWSAFTIQGE
jgi:CHAT domain-containing protein